MRNLDREKGKRAKRETPSGASRFFWAGALAVAMIGLCELFFPNDTLRDPGLFYYLTVIFAALRFGVGGGLLVSAIFTLYIGMGASIPGSAFEHTPQNESRTIGSAIIFAFTTLGVGWVHARIRREADRATRAKEEAEREAERRRQTEAELRESEELRRLVVESSMDAIVATDAGGKIILWNGPAQTMFGWEPEDAKGHPLWEVTGLEVSSGIEFGTRQEARALAKDGRAFDVEIYVVPHRSERGEVRIAFVRDISERKLAEEAIRLLNANLEQRVQDRTAELMAKNEELEGFSYAISHDMRAPLRAIVANARLVLEDEGGRVSDAGRLQLERLAGAALKMSMLVDDLLQYARLGNRSVRLETVDVSALAEASASNVIEEYPNAEINVQPGLRVEADPMLLSLVLNNLLENACKYSKSGVPPRVTLGAKESDGETVFFVADEGVGIDMRFAHNLFRPFERLHNENEYPGTGIGLANVRRCIERQGGRVWLESELGKGTTVLFTLGKADAVRMTA